MSHKTLIFSIAISIIISLAVPFGVLGMFQTEQASIGETGTGTTPDTASEEPGGTIQTVDPPGPVIWILSAIDNHLNDVWIDVWESETGGEIPDEFIRFPQRGTYYYYKYGPKPDTYALLKGQAQASELSLSAWVKETAVVERNSCVLCLGEVKLTIQARGDIAAYHLDGKPEIWLQVDDTDRIWGGWQSGQPASGRPPMQSHDAQGNLIPYRYFYSNPDPELFYILNLKGISSDAYDISWSGVFDSASGVLTIGKYQLQFKEWAEW